MPPPAQPAANALLDEPILRTLLSLAWPNALAFSAGTLVAIAETSYIGRLGVEALAAMALVFPCVMLTMSMSGAAMGGGVSSAIARALGAGDRDRAERLATHALLIAIFFGLIFMLGMLAGGPHLLELLGGRDKVLAEAVAYSQVYFGGAIVIWRGLALAGPRSVLRALERPERTLRQRVSTSSAVMGLSHEDDRLLPNVRAGRFLTTTAARV